MELSFNSADKIDELDVLLYASVKGEEAYRGFYLTSSVEKFFDNSNPPEETRQKILSEAEEHSKPCCVVYSAQFIGLSVDAVASFENAKFLGEWPTEGMCKTVLWNSEAAYKDYFSKIQNLLFAAYSVRTDFDDIEEPLMKKYVDWLLASRDNDEKFNFLTEDMNRFLGPALLPYSERLVDAINRCEDEINEEVKDHVTLIRLIHEFDRSNDYSAVKEHISLMTEKYGS